MFYRITVIKWTYFTDKIGIGIVTFPSLLRYISAEF